MRIAKTVQEIWWIIWYCLHKATVKSTTDTSFYISLIIALSIFPLCVWYAPTIKLEPHMQQHSYMIFTFHIWYLNWNSELLRYYKAPIVCLGHKWQECLNFFLHTIYSLDEFVCMCITMCAKYASNLQRFFLYLFKQRFLQEYE